jgi:hypothetical protein
MFNRSLNPLEVYAEAGRKAAEAVNENDWARSKFHSGWMRKAIALETDQWKQMARKAFDEAYKTTRRV